MTTATQLTPLQPKLFEDNKTYDIPARVVYIAQESSATFVRLFLEGDLDIDKTISGDSTANCYLQNKSKSLKEGSFLIVKIEGKLLNAFLKLGRFSSKQAPPCSFVKVINKDEYIKKLRDFNGLDKKQAPTNNQLEETKVELKKLQDKIATKEKKLKEVDSELTNKSHELLSITDAIKQAMGMQKDEEEKLSTKKSEINEELESYHHQKLKEIKSSLKSFKTKNQWIETIKHHFQASHTEPKTFTDKLTKPADTYQSIYRQLTTSLQLNDSFTHSYLLALFTSLIQGRFLLLTGHIGTGKSHLIKESGELLGGQTNMVAVRPAWLDSSDLLGYFDPLNNKYHATDFVNYLSKQDDNFVNMILLDEMNIARIENYGADILAGIAPITNNKRQLARNQIRLYAQNMQEMLFLHKLYHQFKDKLTAPEQDEFSQLLSQFQSTASISIPNNVMMCGTLNIDGSTENLSPKMIDRSLILKFPDFNGHIGSTQDVEKNKLPISALLSAVMTFSDDASNWDNFYQKYIEQIKNDMLPISRRVADDYLLFIKLAKYFQIDNGKAQVDAYFFYCRILPRLKIERINDEIKEAWFTIFKELDSSLKVSLFDTFIDAFEKVQVGEYLDYQHICG